jgi:Lipid A core - O-antigen ligase and related enzymes
MIGYAALLATLALAFHLIRKDIREREGVSHAIWLPTLWAFVLLSRPLSMWLNFGGGESSLEGSPLDRLFYFGIILASIAIVARRNVSFGKVFAENWPITLFYLYFLMSVTWAPESFVSFKRWFKEVGNIFVALVILSEANPQQAIRAVFVRCAFLLLPLSIIFLRYFPELGRRYLRGGGLEVIGVTTQKNSLGVLVLICGLVLIWDWFERTKPGAKPRTKLDRYLPFLLLSIGVYLLYLCDSKTSWLCLIIGGGMLAASRLPIFRQRVSALGFLFIAGIISFFVLDSVFEIKAAFLALLGRDATLTGRTDVWRELLALKTDPMIGTGFCMIWSDYNLLSRLPDYVGKSAHNGYLEIYIDGGYIGLCFLGLMLLGIALKIRRHLTTADDYALFRFATFIAMIIGNLSESHWGRMAPMGFFFLLTGIGFVDRRQTVSFVRPLQSKTRVDDSGGERGAIPVRP